MLTNFLSQLSRRTRYRRPIVTEKERKALPMKIFGEVFCPGDRITAVVGDVEVPDGSIVDRPVVVKRKIKIGANCQVLKKLKVLGGIIMAEKCTVEIDLESGDMIELGENTRVEGNVEAKATLKLSQGIRILGFADARGAYVI